MSAGLGIFVAIVFLLNIIAGIIIAIEDIYLSGIDKFKYFVVIIFIPILGSLFVLIRFSGGGKSHSSSNYNSASHYSSNIHSSGGEN